MDNSEPIKVKGFDKPISYDDLVKRFRLGSIIYVDKLQTLHELAVQRGDDEIAQLTDIACNYGDEMENMNIGWDMEHLQALKQVSEIYKYRGNAHDIGKVIERKEAKMNAKSDFDR